MPHKKSTSPILAMGIALAFLGSCNSKPAETTADAVTTVDTIASTPVSARPAHWGYEGEDGPAAWATLSPAYALCGEGKGQSPINIVKTDAKGGANWNLDYKTTSLRIAHNEHMDDIIDNGHTIQVTVDEGSTFLFGDKAYDLKQFHFHTPSEHTVDGKNMPMEMHLVHQSGDGSLAVVSVLFNEGKVANENFSKIIANLPNAKGESKHITDANLELKVHLPKDNYGYHYVGSLTTPPCSEGVQWLVLRDMVSLTADQIAAFSSRIGPNNRPTQALNERTVEVDDLVGQINQ
ncbi:carbonic anhydrase [Algoriphagus sp. A40]|uniref:carbonic anhydrase n=1 Tax=Algoriphagus sp. A40 TaxID=1945863 RepID=UPI000985DDA7|nr:carbonic anhydrase family protein [Algoriphagus sp. A40]